MNIVYKFRKTLSLFLSICLVFTYISAHVFASDNSNTNGNIKIIQNDENQIVAKGEGDEYELYATYDVKTHEITMKSVEKPKNVTGLSITKEKVTNYKVKINYAYKGEIDATATEIGSNKQYKLQKGDAKAKIEANDKKGEELSKLNENTNEDSEKVTAQLPILIPIGEWLGAALLAALLGTAAIITIAGIDYIVASKAETDVKNNSYNYFYAYIDYDANNVFIGPAIDSATALSYIASASTHNLWARSSTLAYQICYEFTKKQPVLHTNEWATKGEGYYKHYHPVNMWGSKMPQHVWFF